MKRIMAPMVAALLIVSLVPSVALAAPKTTAMWNVYNINSGGTAYTPKAAPGGTNSLANFVFPSLPTTALLTTTQTKSLLGDLTGKSITATFTISDSPVFTYNLSGGNSCGTPASVRLYFAGNTKGKFTYDTAGYSRYWWSNPVNSTNIDSYTLAGGTMTLTVPLDVNNWSDWGGELAYNVPTYFAGAVSQVSEIGLSFGGGCFFANGVGASGSPSFSLTSYALN
ncbi:MAG: hypothetical protein HY264_10975 [Chloroflexi bacterium]|nr:hypothetical protein [Chloroflexota bacterium]